MTEQETEGTEQSSGEADRPSYEMFVAAFVGGGFGYSMMSGAGLADSLLIAPAYAVLAMVIVLFHLIYRLNKQGETHGI